MSYFLSAPSSGHSCHDNMVSTAISCVVVWPRPQALPWQHQNVCMCVSASHLSGLLACSVQVCFHLVARVTCNLGNRLLEDGRRLSNWKSCVKVRFTSLDKWDKVLVKNTECFVFPCFLPAFFPFLTLSFLPSPDLLLANCIFPGLTLLNTRQGW